MFRGKIRLKPIKYVKHCKNVLKNNQLFIVLSY